MNIVEILQQYANSYVIEFYKKDACEPIYTISSLYDESNYKLIATIKHNGQVLSETIYPTKHSNYGEDELESILKNLYNRTM